MFTNNYRRLNLYAMFTLIFTLLLGAMNTATAGPPPTVSVNPNPPVQHKYAMVRMEGVQLPPSSDYKVAWDFKYLNLMGTQYTRVYTGGTNESVGGSLSTYHLGNVGVGGTVSSRDGSIIYGQASTTTMVVPDTSTPPACTDANEPENRFESQYYSSTFTTARTICAGDVDFGRFHIPVGQTVKVNFNVSDPSCLVTIYLYGKSRSVAIDHTSSSYYRSKFVAGVERVHMPGSTLDLFLGAGYHLFEVSGPSFCTTPTVSYTFNVQFSGSTPEQEAWLQIASAIDERQVGSLNLLQGQFRADLIVVDLGNGQVALKPDANYVNYRYMTPGTHLARGIFWQRSLDGHVLVPIASDTHLVEVRDLYDVYLTTLIK